MPYLERGWTVPQLKSLLKEMGAKARDILRTKGTNAEELGLTKDSVADDDILAAMVRHPVLVNRPIVQTSKGTKLCRPPELVTELL